VFLLCSRVFLLFSLFGYFFLLLLLLTESVLTV